MTAYVILNATGDRVLHGNCEVASKLRWTPKFDSAKEWLTARDAYDWAGCDVNLKDARVVRGDSARLLTMES